MADSSHPGAKTAILRSARNLSVQELASQSGCEPGLIDELERGQLAPSLAPLARISRALGVRLGTLLDEQERVGPVITRLGEARPVTRFRGGDEGPASQPLEYFGLAAGKLTRHMDPFVIAIGPDQGSVASAHEGEELLHVLEGAISVDYGKDTHRLETGDSIYYDSIVPHRVQALDGRAARVLSVVYTPA